MSKGYTVMLGTSVKPQLLKELDRIRGPIPRSKILERVLTEFIRNVDDGKISLLQGVNCPGTHHAATSHPNDNTTQESDTAVGG